MPFYHALFKNNKPLQTADDAGYWTSGGEYNGLFSEEFPREASRLGDNADLVAVHIFKTEDELVKFHQDGEWRNFMK
jgi:hypothetical protein